MTVQVRELVEKINRANISYRTGESVITDTQYDTLLEELEVLDPDNKLITNVGFDVEQEEDGDRKQKLPIVMASMNKVKTFDEIEKWFKSKNIPQNTTLVLTPKFDGLSLCVDEFTNSAWSRGNGILGQRSDEHLKLISRNKTSENIYTFGELIMSREIFKTKYSEEFSNPRNLVAGQINHKTPNEILKDCNYISYGMEQRENSGLFENSFYSKTEQLDFLNSIQKHRVEYRTISSKDITEGYIYDLFSEWNKEYEIDGIIVEVNDMELRKKLGRETSSKNPCFARAFKGNFEEVKEAKVLNITWHISKHGLLKPVINIETTVLDGVNVSNVTGNNAKFMKDMGIGIGTILKVKRSGMVIPMVVSVVSSTGFVLPTIPNIDIEWNENEVELVTTSITDEQRLKQLIGFFAILEVDNMGEGTLKQFFNNGFDTPQKVLEMSKTEMLKMDKFGKRKSEIVSSAIDDKRNVTLSKVQHASGFFTNLGSKKLLLLENFDETTSKQTIENVEGFSDISAENYLKGIDLYNDWIKDFDGLLTISKTEVKEVVTDGGLDGMSFVFSGVRRADLNIKIESMGGKIVSGISKNSTHLVMKVTGTGSAKEKKALSLNQTILTVEELEELLNV